MKQRTTFGLCLLARAVSANEEIPAGRPEEPRYFFLAFLAFFAVFLAAFFAFFAMNPFS